MRIGQCGDVPNCKVKPKPASGTGCIPTSATRESRLVRFARSGIGPPRADDVGHAEPMPEPLVDQGSQRVRAERLAASTASRRSDQAICERCRPSASSSKEAADRANILEALISSTMGLIVNGGQDQRILSEGAFRRYRPDVAPCCCVRPPRQRAVLKLSRPYQR